MFDGLGQRVFEVTREELIGGDPDVLGLLHADGSADVVMEAVTSLKGASPMRAVAKHDIMVQLFNCTEPPSPLSVDGLQRILERFDQ